MESIIRDIHFALRGLLKRPVFAAIAVATLALGIGANTAIFSVVNAVLLRPLPLKEPDRLMTFWHSAPAKGLAHMDLNEALVAYYRVRTGTFESLAAFENDLLGRRIRISGGPWLTIVGVVPNVKNRKLDENAWPYIYRPYSQWVRRNTMLVVRTSVDPSTIAGSVRQEVAKLDPELPLANVNTIRNAIDRSLVTTRLTNWLLAGFAATALLLALTGMYGVMSLNIANRRNEFGIRLA